MQQSKETLRSKVYFQKQGWTLECGRHSLNNLIGGPAFTKQDLDNVASQLSDDCINPHRHCCGGEYDINVLLICLQKEGMKTEWHDKRNKYTLQELNKGPLQGFLVNKAFPKKCYHALFCLSARHWLVVKKVRDNFAILDSVAKKSIPDIVSQEEIVAYLGSILDEEGEIIKVLQDEPNQVKKGYNKVKDNNVTMQMEQASKK